MRALIHGSLATLLALFIADPITLQILKLGAEAQLGTPADKVAVVAYAQGLLKDGAARDVESLELLEWAASDIAGEEFFGETIGPLRVRLVKANPKDRVTAVDCLESCLLHWDLSSAQQVGSSFSIYDFTFSPLSKCEARGGMRCLT